MFRPDEQIGLTDLNYDINTFFEPSSVMENRIGRCWGTSSNARITSSVQFRSIIKGCFRVFSHQLEKDLVS